MNNVTLSAATPGMHELTPACGACCLDYSQPYLPNEYALLSSADAGHLKTVSAIVLSPGVINALLAGLVGIFIVAWLVYGFEHTFNLGIHNVDQAVYFAITTLTSVGYGARGRSARRRRCLVGGCPALVALAARAGPRARCERTARGGECGAAPRVTARVAAPQATW